MELRELKGRLMRDPEFAREYQALEPEMQIAAALIRIRHTRNWTQEQLASAVNRKQEYISRLESGTAHPNLDTLDDIARRLGLRVHVTLEPLGAVTPAHAARPQASPGVSP